MSHIIAMGRRMESILGRISRLAPVAGLFVLLELMFESLLVRHGVAQLTIGSPLAYRGLLVEIPGALWFLTLWASLGDRSDRAARALRANLPRYLLVIAGIGAIGACWWYLYQRSRIPHAPWQYYVATICALLVFVDLGTRPASPILDTVRQFPTDLKHLWGRRTAHTLVAVVAIVYLAPSAEDTRAMRTRPPVGDDFVRWYDGQAKVHLPAAYSQASTVVATFVDYQCPACAAAHRELSPVFSQLKRELGEELSFISIDFPLDAECNARPEVVDIHPLACHAATLVRLQQDGREAFIDRLFTVPLPDSRAALEGLYGGDLPKADAYRAARLLVSADAAIGYELGIRATPTYLVDGVVVERRPAREMERLIRHVAARKREALLGPKGQQSMEKGGS